MKILGFKTAAIGMLFASIHSGAASACADGHWIQSVSSDGTIIKLEDGSVWEVTLVDALTSTLWLPTTQIIACDSKLINSDDGEKVDAIRLK